MSEPLIDPATGLQHNACCTPTWCYSQCPVYAKQREDERLLKQREKRKGKDPDSIKATPADSIPRADAPSDAKGERDLERQGEADRQGKKIKVIKVGERISFAIAEVHARKEVGYHVNYDQIAIQYGTTGKSLKSYYYRWKKGVIQISIDQTPEEKAVDRKQQHEKIKMLTQRNMALVLKQYEGALYAAEDRTFAESKEGVQSDWKSVNKDVSYLRGELFSLLKTEETVNKGYDAFLEEHSARISRQKPVTPALPDSPKIPENKIQGLENAADKQRMYAALDALPPLEVEAEVVK